MTHEPHLPLGQRHGPSGNAGHLLPHPRRQRPHLGPQRAGPLQGIGIEEIGRIHLLYLY
jgi:hypothetical protein